MCLCGNLFGGCHCENLVKFAKYGKYVEKKKCYECGKKTNTFYCQPLECQLCYPCSVDNFEPNKKESGILAYMEALYEQD